MSQHIYDRIRQALETTPGLTQKGLAERMGLNPAAVNRMLYGRRNIMADEIPIIENYLGIRLDLSAPAAEYNFEYRQDAAEGRRGFSDITAQPLPSSPHGDPAARLVPVYGHASGSLKKNLDLSRGDVVAWVPRHPAQFGTLHAFAVYVTSESMEPRYFPGEIVYIHPGKPPELNKDCIVEMTDGEAFIRRFLRQGDGSIRVAQFNPPEEKEVPASEIKAVYAIVGRG